MSNEKFEDMAVLSTLARLRAKNLLSETDAEALRMKLKSEWGKRVFVDLQTGAPQPEDRVLLGRFSTAFAR
jgi:hypothetical protein